MMMPMMMTMMMVAATLDALGGRPRAACGGQTVLDRTSGPVQTRDQVQTRVRAKISRPDCC
jgi:hypothetical protein